MICLNNELREIKVLIQKARKKTEETQQVRGKLYDKLYELCAIPLEEAVSRAENAMNLEEAIECYIQYNEYNIAGLMKEIRNIIVLQERHI